jgi:hypothetical protein
VVTIIEGPQLPTTGSTNVINVPGRRMSPSGSVTYSLIVKDFFIIATGIVDMPGHRPIVDALAGEGGHAPLKPSRAARTIVMIVARAPSVAPMRLTLDRPFGSSPPHRI